MKNGPHDIQRRQQTDRLVWIAANRDVWVKRVSEEEVVRATNEFRPSNQVWLWLKTKKAWWKLGFIAECGRGHPHHIVKRASPLVFNLNLG